MIHVMPFGTLGCEDDEEAGAASALASALGGGVVDELAGTVALDAPSRANRANGVQ